MIVDRRAVEPQRGRLHAFLALQQKGAAVRRRHLGNPGSVFATEIGNADEIVHTSAHGDSAARSGRHTVVSRLFAEAPRKHGHNKILVPPPFLPTN